MKNNKLEKYFYKIYKKNKEDFFEELDKILIKGDKKIIITANPETIMISEKNEKLKNIYFEDNTIITPDGIGIVIGAKRLGYRIESTITGVDITNELLKICNEKNKSLYIFGSKQIVIDKMKELIKKEYSNIDIVGMENGYIKDKNIIKNDIIKKQPEVVMVALGIPKQEIFIYDIMKELNKGVFIGIGGTLDVLSGVKKRAPKIFIKLKIEWLYRIVTEPKRMKRFFKSNIAYLFELFK